MAPEPAPDSFRALELTRQSHGRYQATNSRGGVLPIGTGDDTDFTPVELLLAAIAGCSAIDVDFITSKRTEPDRMVVHVSGDKIRDELGSRMVNLTVEFDVDFPAGEQGDAARKVLPDAIEKSRDRICTVSRTVAVESPVAMRPIAG